MDLIQDYRKGRKGKDRMSIGTQQTLLSLPSPRIVDRGKRKRVGRDCFLRGRGQDISLSILTVQQAISRGGGKTFVATGRWICSPGSAKYREKQPTEGGRRRSTFWGRKKGETYSPEERGTDWNQKGENDQTTAEEKKEGSQGVAWTLASNA